MNMASYITLATACITIISAVAGLGWWLSNQFSHSHQLFYEAISELRAGFQAALERHEEKTIERFRETEAQIHKLELRNAQVDGERSATANGRMSRHGES